MKINLKRLAITALLLSSTSMALADGGFSSKVGDLPGFGEDAYFDDGVAYVGDEASYDQQSDAVSQTSMAEPLPVQQASTPDLEFLPVGYSSLQPVGYNGSGRHQAGRNRINGRFDNEYVNDGGYAPACGCENGCDDGCNSSRCNSSRCVRRRCNLPKLVDCNCWATAEALLWFPQARQMPILISSAASGVFPVLSPGGRAGNGINNEFGGEIDGGLSAGFRVDYGKWLTKNVGIGGRFWWLGENGESISMTGLDGSDGSVGRPFFDTNPIPSGVGENALLISFLDPDLELTGDVSAESNLKILAAELYGRFRLGSSKTHQLDLIGGYSYFQIDDELRINSSTTVIDAPTDPPGFTRTFADSFDAENRFNGGQVGFELSATRGCWMVRSLTKVHLGNMNQTYNIAGRSSSGNPFAGPPPEQYNIGMLAQEGNIGTFERDKFAFAPEANFKLAYRFRPNVLLSVGYSFIYFDNVALNGSVVDRTLDGSLLGTGNSGERPAFVFDDSSLWVHGIDLGAVIDF